MSLSLFVLPALFVLVEWGTSCSTPVATRPVPPVKTRPVQDLPLSTGTPPTPAVQTEVSPPHRGSEAKPPGAESPLAGEGTGRVREEPEEEARGLPQIIGKHFDAYGFHEDEVGGHHEHGMVTLDGINLFVLRADHVYKNPLERAKAVARLLEESLHIGDPLFILGKDEEDPAIYSVSHHGGFPRLIVTVTKGDAHGYSHRSGRTVSQTELGQWWLGWLEDLVALVLLEKPHTHLPVQQVQEPLSLLGQRLREVSLQGPYTQAQVGEALEALNEKTRTALQSLALRLPRASPEQEIPWGDGHQ